ncbi:MAG: DEAD/DEAH box helicase [Mesorhizobium sp.]|nr:MAG: DEAD/DEAH box helicase [Mesorhizobium sp.]
MRIVFRTRVAPDGLHIEALQKGLLGPSIVPPRQWPTFTGAAAVAARVISSAIARQEAREEATSVILSHTAVTGLHASIAGTLGIAPLARLSATLSFEDRVDSLTGRIRVRWYDANTRPVLGTRTGAFVTVGEDIGRLTGALFRLTEGIDAYNASTGQPIETRIGLWQPVQEALRESTGVEVKSDQYLASLTIYQAGSFALDVKETPNGPDFTPVLMSRGKAATLEDVAPSAEGDEDEPTGKLRDQIADALLPPELQQRFVSERYESSGRTHNAYVLGRNVFVVLDPDLRQALDVVRKMRSAPREARRAFIRNPRPALSEALGREEADAVAAALFVETQQYSERVLGLGVWERPALPWLQNKAGQWLPEGFALKLRDKTLILSPEGVEQLSHQVQAAKVEGHQSLAVMGTEYAISEVEGALVGIGPSNTDPLGEDAKEEEEPYQIASDVGPAQDDRQVLLISQNLEDADYVVAAPKRVASIPLELPSELMGNTRAKPHQKTGLSWLLNAWLAGRPGVLLADDMGLGKTFQALGFLAWTRTNRKAQATLLTPLQRGPILIVAPTALLNNWIVEAEQHLAPDALGDRVDAFGPGLKRLKQPRSESWSPEDSLDTDVLRHADWILTTYETLADNHRAFARVGYSVAVFDEMQKVKDPRTINTHAAKAMNADFVLGLTGTPIENRLEDLWCIMDRVAPGFLGDLKRFSEEHTEDQPHNLKALKEKLDEPQADGPPMMLRRMKENHIQGLPEKRILSYATDMPSVQAEAYMDAVRVAQAGERSHGAMLKAIHALRGISLHPQGAKEVDPYDTQSGATWLGQSARLTRAVEILRHVKAVGEKALIFIEDRAVQKAFAGVAATLFDLRVEPTIINGEVPGHRRQEYVKRFQETQKGFDLLVLSPKAAGIGLTITAANHVIHLSRWWNPAVEDQCNDRCYRIGQDKPVTIHLPIAIHPTLGDASFDVTLDRLLTRKRSLSRNMLAPPVSDGDIGALFGATISTN